MIAFDIGISKVGFIGDVHLGRVFRRGVPLHRRGERERMVWDQFEHEMFVKDFDLIVQVGDLFDKFRVELNVVVATAEVIREAASRSPSTQFVFLAGNHDLSKDVSRISSFELAAKLLRDVRNVAFVIDHPVTISNILMLPYYPFQSAAEAVENYLNRPTAPDGQYDAIVGHWDRMAVGDEFNLIPLDALAAKTGLVISGHDHTPADIWDGKTRVVYTGSMQPYSHGEDPDSVLYRTFALADLPQDDSLVNKCVRVLANKGDVIPDIDCLQLTIKRLDLEGDDLTVEFEDGLNMNDLFDEVMSDVDPDVTVAVKAQYNEVRNA